jgi:mannitol 2-dehydrogenase
MGKRDANRQEHVLVPSSLAVPLSSAALPRLPLRAPGYDRSAIRVGIVHVGVGGFHRAHQAMYVDRLMNAGLDMDWGICGMGLLPSDAAMRDALAGQDFLYTLVTKHADGSVDAQIIGSIVDYMYVPDNPEAAIEQLADPGVRIVSLTITEGGYNFIQATGAFNAAAPDVAHDLLEARSMALDPRPARPRSIFGLVVEALHRRRARHIAPFTIMSCDNIQSNGDVARRQFVAYAALRDTELANWISCHAAFPNSMVDRITPVTTEADRLQLADTCQVKDRWPVACEPFSQWVLEDAFVSGRPSFEAAGVQLVADVEPYELMKLRLLNASHQALCYPGYLAGYRFAHEVCADSDFAGYLRGYMDREATPTLHPVPGIDLPAYKAQLIERFANPAIKDTLARLCAESSDRIPKWVLPVIHDNLEAGRPVDFSAAIVASWARYAEGVDEDGRSIQIIDQRSAQVTLAAMQQRTGDRLAFVRDRGLFADLANRSEFTEPYLRALRSFHSRGARATIGTLATEGRLAA